jgi:hypothetical protein
MKKAVIVKIGTIDENGMPNGWTFNCDGMDAINIGEEVLVGGYTTEELRDIYEASKDAGEKCVVE